MMNKTTLIILLNSLTALMDKKDTRIGIILDTKNFSKEKIEV